MKWKLETRNIKDISEDKNNPRWMSKKQADGLQQSLEKFGICQPIVLNRDGIIIGGHQRFKVLKRLGYETIDVYVSSIQLSEKQKEELSIRLNKNLGEWDFDVLANSWEMQDLLNWGFGLEEFDFEPLLDSPTEYVIQVTCHSQEEFNFIEDRVQDLLDLFPNLIIQTKEKCNG